MLQRSGLLIAALILIFGIVLLFGRLETENKKLATQQTAISTLTKANKLAAKNQLINRVSNVHTWCSAINEGRNEGRARAKKTPGAPPFKLKNLDCPRLEFETAHSSLGKKLPVPKWVK